MTIGVCGPVDLRLLECDLPASVFPKTTGFPLVSHFINGLLRRGYNVVVYTNSIEVKEPLILNSGPLKICIARQKAQPGRRFFNYEIEELKNIILQHPSDVISAFWSYEYARAALKTKIPTVVSLHDVATVVLKYHKDLFRVVRWVLNKTVVSRAEHLIANSAYTYNSLSAHQKAKTEIINNFYTDSLLQDAPQHIKKQNYIITVAQGFSRRKNITTSLQAFAILKRSKPDLEYYLVGDDMEEGGLAHAYAKQHNLEEGVKFIGAKPFKEVLELVAGAKALIHPSLEESFGMVILEAMVLGTVVVGGKKSGYVPYLLDFGNAGVLCDVSSPKAIATALFNLLEDEPQQQTLISKAKQFAHDNYAEPAILDQHIAYLKSITANHKSKVPDTSFELVSYLSPMLGLDVYL